MADTTGKISIICNGSVSFRSSRFSPLLSLAVDCHGKENIWSHIYREAVRDTFKSQDDNSDCSWIQNTHEIPIEYFNEIGICLKSTELFEATSQTPNFLYKCIDKPTFYPVLALREVFNTKRVVFIGDSTMRQQLIHFGCMLGFPTDLMRIPKEFIFNYTAIKYYNSVELNYFNVSISYVPLGKIWKEHGQTKVLLEIMKNEWQRKPDAIVLNQGIHHQDVESEVAQEEDSLIYMANIVADFYRKRDIASNGLNNETILIWKETNPQNFPSSNGFYMNECGAKFHNCKCCPLSVSMELGQGLKNNCQPGCFAANTRNLLTNGIISAAGIHISHVYDPLVKAQWNIHLGEYYDCTHLNTDAILFVNNAWLHIFIALAGRENG